LPAAFAGLPSLFGLGGHLTCELRNRSAPLIHYAAEDPFSSRQRPHQSAQFRSQVHVPLSIRSCPRDSSAAVTSAPDPCQILRGTTGNTGERSLPPSGQGSLPPHLRKGADPESPKLPKLRAFGRQAASEFSLRVCRRGLFRSTAPAAWLRPVVVRRGTRAPCRLADPPPWLTVFGRGPTEARFSPLARG
jgi:hypothetical protein